MTVVEGHLLAGRWRMGDQIGRGAVADVHEAVDDATGQRVAVKVLRHAEAGQRVRFEREVTALESLEHPNVVKVLGHGEPTTAPTWCWSTSTAGRCGRHRRRPAVAGAGRGGGRCPRRRPRPRPRPGLVHRDVKPSNVLLDGDGVPRLCDFGVAQLDGSGTLTASGFTVGTAAYLAPEQVRGSRSARPRTCTPSGCSSSRPPPVSGRTRCRCQRRHGPPRPAARGARLAAGAARPPPSGDDGDGPGRPSDDGGGRP